MASAVWVAHASRMLAKASRFCGLFGTLHLPRVVAVREVCFGATPKPTRETRALPRQSPRRATNATHPRNQQSEISNQQFDHEQRLRTSYTTKQRDEGLSH